MEWVNIKDFIVYKHTCPNGKVYIGITCQKPQNRWGKDGNGYKEQLFYIMTRGLSYKEAVRLLVKANFNKIIEGIQDEEVKTEILQEIDKRL